MPKFIVNLDVSVNVTIEAANAKEAQSAACDAVTGAIIEDINSPKIELCQVDHVDDIEDILEIK